MDVVVAGTGSMGAPIVLNLLKKGFAVGVWNRDQARLRSLLDAGATPALDVSDDFGAPVVLSVLSDDAAAREVFLAESTLSSMGTGSVHVNRATISPVLAREAVDVHAVHQVGYVAALMFCGVPVAEVGRLNLTTAGRTEDLERVMPSLAAFSAGLSAWWSGPVPMGAGRRGIYTSTIMSGPVHSMYGSMIAESRFEPARLTPELDR